MMKTIFENYVVYSDGRLWSKHKRDFLVPQDNGSGYMKVLLRINGKPKTCIFTD